MTSTVEDSQDALKETSTEANTNDSPNGDVSISSPTPVDRTDSSDTHQLSSKEKLAKFSFEHKAQ